jgi:hypothetical protein
MVERSVLKERNAGMLVRYSRPGKGTSWIDVFVYPICLPKPCSLALINEIQMARVLKDVETAHPGAVVQDIESFIGERNDRKYEALKAKIEIPEDLGWRSYVYLAAIDDVYVKIRFSEPRGSDHEGQVDAFAAALLTQFSFKDSSSHKHEVACSIYISPTEAERGNVRMLSVLLLYGAVLSVEIEKYGRFMDTFDRAVKCWEITLTTFGGEGSQKGSAGDETLAGMLSVYKAGYLKEYLWTHFRGPYWIRPEGLRLGDYDTWASHCLKNHVPYDTNRVIINWK